MSSLLSQTSPNEETTIMERRKHSCCSHEPANIRQPGAILSTDKEKEIKEEEKGTHVDKGSRIPNTANREGKAGIDFKVLLLQVQFWSALVFIICVLVAVKNMLDGVSPSLWVPIVTLVSILICVIKSDVKVNHKE